MHFHLYFPPLLDLLSVDQNTSANAGCILIPCASFIFLIVIAARKQLFRHCDTLFSTFSLPWLCFNKKMNLNYLWNCTEAVMFNRITWAHLILLGIWIIYSSFISGLGLNKIYCLPIRILFCSHWAYSSLCLRRSSWMCGYQSVTGWEKKTKEVKGGQCACCCICKWRGRIV